MLAIMNVGKYVIPSVVPSGENIFRVLNDSALSSNVRFFASNGSRIVGIVTNGCVYSNDEGMSWSNYHLNYQLAHIAYLNNTFYAVEESGNPLHYGTSSDGITWTWNTISDVPAGTSTCYGIAVVEETDGIKINYATQVNTESSACYLSSYFYNLSTSSSYQAGETIQYSSPTSSTRTFRVSKRNSKAIGDTYLDSGNYYNFIVGDFGAEEVSKTNDYFFNCESIGDRFIYGKYVSSGSSTSTKWRREMYYSSNGVNWQNVSSDTKFTNTFKPYGFFKVGNTFYLAFTKGNDDAYWVKAGSLLGALNMPDDEIEKVSDVDLPVSFYAITNKKIVLATTTSHIYTCEIG